MEPNKRCGENHLIMNFLYKTLKGILYSVLLLSTLNTFAQITNFEAPVEEYYPGRLYVRTQDPNAIAQQTRTQNGWEWRTDNSRINEIFKRNQVDNFLPVYPNSDNDSLRAIYLLSCAGCDEKVLMDELKNTKGSPYYKIVRDMIPQACHTPNDWEALPESNFAPGQCPVFDNFWYLDTIKARQAWNITTGDPRIKIGLIDIADVDISHPELNDKLSTDDIATVTFADGTGICGAIYGEGIDYTPNTVSHATQTICVAGAETNNAQGIVSVGYNCGLMYGCASSGSANWLVENGADVIVYTSLMGGSNSPYEEEILDGYYNHDVVFVGSAGNYGLGHYGYPAAFDEVLCVSGVRFNDELETQSYCDPDNPKKTFSLNSAVDLTAPASMIRIPYNNGSYGWGDGTSYSSPQVAGTAGLIRSINPCLPAPQVYNMITSTTDNINYYPYNVSYAQFAGSGRLNVFEAVYKAAFRSPYDCNVPINQTIDQDFPQEDDFYGSKQFPGIYRTTESLSSSSIIDERGEMLFRSAKSITFTDGFHAKEGAKLTSEIVSYYPCCEPEFRPENNIGKTELETVVAEPIISFDLGLQNTPNPFSSDTNIEFELPTETAVTITVYDLLGQVIAQPVQSQVMSAGAHYIPFYAEAGMEAGMYFYSLETADGHQATSKMMVVK